MLRRTVLIALVVLVCLAVSALPAIATSWNLASDYSTTANPNGAWSYGWASNSNAGYTFNLYTVCHLFSNMPCWDIAQSITPGVICNNTGTAQTYGCCPMQPGEAGFHPGSNGEISIYRFTAPAARNYMVSASFTGLSGTGKDVHVIKNRTGGLFDQQIWNSSAYYNGIVPLASGDTLDFVLGYGDGNYNSDSTTVSATISDTWDAAADFSTSTSNTGTWSYGWLPAASNTFTLATEQVGSSFFWNCPAAGWRGYYPGVAPNPASAETWLFKNTSASPTLMTYDGWQGYWLEPGKLCIQTWGCGNQPAHCGDMTTIRWTAPQTGTYNITSAFTGADFNPYQGWQQGYYAHSYVYVEKNIDRADKSELFRGTIDGFAGKAANGYADSYGTSPKVTYTGFLCLNSGDTIDFGVTYGPDRSPNWDGVGVDATITSPYSGSVSGTVRYGSTGDYRASGATVSAASGQYSTTTATDGTYSLPLPAGTYTVVCSKAGFANKQQTNVVVTAGQQNTQNFAFAAGRVYGTVTADVTLNTPLASATVTSTDGACSTTTGTDGTYSFMLAAATNAVAGSKAGYSTVTTASFAISDGGAYQKDLKLLPSNPLTLGVALPAPTEWAAPTSAPAAPGDTFTPSLVGTSGAVSPGAPAIAEWSRTAMPDESFTLTGARFTSLAGADSGTDTTVWVWATGTGGGLRQAKLWTVADNAITATIPAEFTVGMYLVWVENKAGVSTPVCINKTKVEWMGPLGSTAPASATSTKRVFGKNISHNHVEGGATGAYVYVQAAGGGSFTSCSVSTADPYSVTFTVPSLSAGNYNVFVHNGHGGQYGWSDPLPLTIAAAWTRNARNQPVNSTYPGDDTAAIQSALNTMGGYGDGGTVTLNTGTYLISNTLTIPAGVRLKGTNSTSTFIRVQGAQTFDPAINVSGSHAMLDSFDIRVIDSAYNPYSVWNVSGDDCCVSGVKWESDQGVDPAYCCPYGCSISGKRCEVSGGEGYRQIGITGADSWLHGATLHGGVYNANYAAEAAINGSGPRSVVEGNTVQTDWPYNGTNYNYLVPYNYNQVVDTTVIPGGWPALNHMVWSKRMFLCVPGSGGANYYIARNTSNNVAVQDNKGEMILLHGGAGGWFGNVLSSNGTTVNLRCDGLVDPGTGSAQALSILDDYSVPVVGGSNVPDTFGSGALLDDPINGASCLIIGGNGFGQVRKIVSHTRNSVTVDKPWRVQPDSTSRAVLSLVYKDFLIYKNTMNAFPPLYNQHADGDWTASQTLQIGNGYGCVSESNVFNRTRLSPMICGHGLAPIFWNDVRSDTANTTEAGGLAIGWWSSNPAGEVALGNRILNSTWSITGAYTGCASSADGTGTVIEHNTFSGLKAGFLAPTEETLYRANNVTVKNTGDCINGVSYIPGPVGVYFGALNNNPILVGNTYSSSDSYQTYYAGVACNFAQKPVALNRVARFKGFVGGPVSEVYIPIANVGTGDFNVSTITKSDTWISTAEIIRGGSLHAEQDAAELLVAIDTSSMSGGTTWGSVTVSDGTKSAKIGVRVDLSGVGPGTNLAGWYKADDATISKDGNNYVGTWPDASGNGKSATQSTQSYKPLWVASAVNSKPSVRFAGTDDYLRTASLVLSGTTQFSCFSFHKFNALTLYNSYQRPWWHGGTTVNAGYGYYITTGTAYQKSGWATSTGVVTDTTAATTSKWFLIDSTYDAARNKMWDNGSYLGSAAKTGSSFTGYLNIGNYATNTQGFNGDMTELMFYSRCLSDPERQLVESYLQMKYGAPTATFTANPASGNAPLTVTFSSTSIDPEGTTMSYTWKFGDGASVTTASTSTSHQYTVPGTYYATVIVTDASGVSKTAARQTIQVNSGFKMQSKTVQKSPDAAAATVSPQSSAAKLSLTADPVSPASVGSEVKLSASGLSEAAQYQFLAKCGAEWKMLQDYSAYSTFVWKPSVAGDYLLKVKARRLGAAEETVSPEVAFTVTSFTTDGLSCWLRADKGVTADSAGLVSLWSDQSRAQAGASAEGAAKPLLISESATRPVVRFDGAHSFMYSAADLGYQGGLGVFLVHKANSGGAGESVPVLVGNLAEGNAFRALHLTDKYGFVIGPKTFISGAEVLRDSLNLLTFTASDRDGVAALRGNGVGLESVATDNPTVFGAGYFLGGLPRGYWFAGDIAEVLIYNRPLSNDERDAIESYLMTKYALR